MRFKIVNLMLIAVIATVAFTSCDLEAEALEIQKPHAVDDQYYTNLRAWKATMKDRQVSFGYYAAWAPLEGTEGEKIPSSWGERIMGLPDSFDIVNLWMGIPTPDWQKLAYEDMIYCQKVKGTRFVYHADASKNNPFEYDGVEYTIATNSPEAEVNEYIEMFAKWIVRQVLDNNLDGVDVDYEPSNQNPSIWLIPSRLTTLFQELGKYFGPQGIHPDKLLIVDYYSHSNIPAEVEPFVDYWVRQAYTQGFTEHSAARLQSYYNVYRSFLPAEKFIVVETFGGTTTTHLTGGSPFTEADGNTLTAEGTQMYSLEGMARWHPVAADGTIQRKGGFGGFYFGRDYTSPAGPYYNIRRCIQIANPAVH